MDKNSSGIYGALGQTVVATEREWTSLACTFCFPISDHVMFPTEFSFLFFSEVMRTYARA